MSTIYDEALLDAKKIRETAEQAARNKIMETITPQIRDLINKRILFEEAASLDEEETTDEFEEEESEDFDVDNLVDSLPDVDLDAEEMASKEAVKRASAVTIHASGDVNIDIDADEDDEADDNEFEFDAKMAGQSPYYYTSNPDKDPANAKTDSVKTVAKPVEAASKVTAKL